MSERWKTDKREVAGQTAEFFDALLRASPDGIVATNAAQKIIMVNEAFCGIFQKRCADVVETDLFVWLEQLDADAPRRWAELAEHVRLGKASRDVRFRIQRNDGVRDLSVNASVVEQVGQQQRGVMVSIWRDVTDRKLADEVLRDSQRQVAIRNRIDKAFFTDTEEMYGDVLEIILEALNSKYGVFGYINRDGDLVCPSMTRDVWDKCRIPDKDIVFPRETWAGIWGRAMMECKTAYSNEPFRVPEGHIPIFRALVVPTIRHGEAIGHILVANRATDYDENDVTLLEMIASHISPLLSARLRRQEEEKARKDAEQALRGSEQRYRALFQQAADSIVIVDPQTGALVEFNDKAHEGLGYTREEFRKLKVPDFEVVESPEEVAEHIEKIIREGADSFETRHKTKSGEIRDIQVSCRVVSIHGKNLIQTIWRDITEPKRAAEALQGSERRYRALFEQAPGSVVIVDPQTGALVEFNDKAHEGLGYTREEFRKLKVLDFVVVDSPDEVAEHNEKVAREGADSFESRHKTKSGEVRDVQVSARVICIRGKDLIQAIWRDITEPKRAAEALRDSERRYRALFEQAADSVVIVDPRTGALVEFNDRAHESLGYTREEFRKLKIADLEVAESPEEVAEHIEKIIREGADSFETRHKTKSGEIRDIQISTRVVSVRGKDLMQGIWRDITAHRQAESEKLAAAGRLAARIGHEINNPLAGIKNSFLVVKSALPQGHPCWEFVKLIDKEIDRIARILHQTLDVYRPQPRGPEPFRIDKTIHDVIALLETECGTHRVSIIPEIPADLGHVHLAKDAVVQVLFNVLGNAIEASPEEGKIRIALAAGQKSMTISVADEGQGIPAHIRSEIFEPFFTTKPASGKAKSGAGLGLSISRSLVESMGGSMDFESEVGRGTVFRIRLPRAHERNHHKEGEVEP